MYLKGLPCCIALKSVFKNNKEYYDGERTKDDLNH